MKGAWGSPRMHVLTTAPHPVLAPQVRVEAAEVERELKDRLGAVLEQMQTRLDLENTLLAHLEQLTRDFEASDAARAAEWQAKLDAVEARYRSLAEDRDELQASRWPRIDVD